MVSADADPTLLKTVLSTVISPLPLNIVIIYQHYDVGYLLLWPQKPVPLVEFTPEGKARVALRHRQRFKGLREMYMVRSFRLVLCADVLDTVTEHTTQALERVVNAEKAKGGLDYLLHEPLIVSEIRSPRTRLYDHQAGRTRRHAIRGSAL